MAFGKKNQLFGLDIGSSALKLTEIRKTGKGYQVLNAGMVPLAQEAIVEGAIMNAPAVVDGILQLLGDGICRLQIISRRRQDHAEDQIPVAVGQVIELGQKSPCRNGARAA